MKNKNRKDLLEYFWNSVVQSLKSGKTRKMASFSCRSRKSLRFFSWYSLPDLKHDQKRSIRIPSLNVPEMSLLALLANFINGYHGNDDCYKNFDFSFGYVFSGSMTVQSFVTIKLQEKKLSVIRIFNFFLFLTTLTVQPSSENIYKSRHAELI